MIAVPHATPTGWNHTTARRCNGGEGDRQSVVPSFPSFPNPYMQELGIWNERQGEGEPATPPLK